MFTSLNRFFCHFILFDMFQSRKIMLLLLSYVVQVINARVFSDSTFKAELQCCSSMITQKKWKWNGNASKCYNSFLYVTLFKCENILECNHSNIKHSCVCLCVCVQQVAWSLLCVCAHPRVCVCTCVGVSVAEWSRVETTRLSQLWFGFESHDRQLSVANGRLLLHSQEQSVTPAVETDRHI